MNIDCECQQKHKRPRCGCGVRIASVTIPAGLGTSDPGQPNAPENGAYKNAVVRYQADGKVFFYTSEGIPVKLSDGYQDISVSSVNGKKGDVVLTTADIENVSHYATEEYVDEQIETVEVIPFTTEEWAEFWS